MSDKSKNTEARSETGKGKKVSDLQPPKVIAVLVSDLHLSHTPPIARSIEDNWYECMEKQLLQLVGFCTTYKCPLIVAGDFFDKWTNPPELINFAISMFKEMEVYGIPGQHDLRNHSYDDIKKTSYWTLVESEAIVNLRPGVPIPFHSSGWFVVGYPWGQEVKPVKGPTSNSYLAVIHKYIWSESKNTGYTGAPLDCRAKSYFRKLEGFDAALFGDNHKGFYLPGQLRTDILNAGTFMRRKIDEINYKPMIGLLEVSGKITCVNTECGEDKFLDIEKIEKLTEAVMDIAEIVRILGTTDIQRKLIDFRDAVKEFCESNNVSALVKSLLSEMME